MTRELAVEVRKLSKTFRLPLDHGLTLQHRFVHPISTRKHRTLHAVRDISFDVPKGQFLGITGPNGCGKSTLLKMLAGIYEPDAGQILLRGVLSPFLELGVGFKPELSARDNIVLAGTMLGVRRAHVLSRLNDVLDFAELSDFDEQKLKNFSSGMVVRLAFAVAMLADADVLLMDEVLAVGDQRFQERCFDVFAHYKREGRTVILVSHDLSALEEHCDRVLLMSQGSLAMDGRSADVISQYRRQVEAEHQALPASDEPVAASAMAR